MRLALQIFWFNVRGRWLEWQERRREAREGRAFDVRREVRLRWRVW